MSRDPFEETSTPDYGPEWWAQDREFFCDACGHSAYRHRERLSDGDPAPCGECACEDFTSEAADRPLNDTMATGDDPSSRQT